MNDGPGCANPPCPVAFALISAARSLESHLEQVLGTHQLSIAKFGVLRCLVHEARPMPLSAIAQRQRCVRSNITQLADRLEADGLLRRIDDPQDRRAVLAEPTAAGRAACVAADAALRLEEARLLGPLSADEREVMTALVGRYAGATVAVTTP